MNIRPMLAMFVLLGACGMPNDDEIASSRSALSGPPEVAGEEFLNAAGVDTAGLFQDWPRVLCSVNLHTTGSDEIEKTVTCSAPSGFLMATPAWAYENRVDKCSYTFNFVRGGTNYSRIEEIDRNYGRAIDLALKAGKFDIAIKIGQMRDYAKAAYAEKSETDAYVLWARAKSRWYESSGAFCDVSLIAHIRKM